jgi:hypothetical protein
MRSEFVMRQPASSQRRVALLRAGCAGVLLAPALAWAYVGPGLGAGAVAAVLGIFFGLLAVLAGVVWYPIKRLLKKFKAKK